MASSKNGKAAVYMHGLCRFFEKVMDSTRYYEAFYHGDYMGDYFAPSPPPRPVLNELRFFGSSEAAVDQPDVVKKLLANADVWERIFGFLDQADRLCLQSVCKRLKELTELFWLSSRTFDWHGIEDLILGCRLNGSVAIATFSAKHSDAVRRLLLRDGLCIDENAEMLLLSQRFPEVESIVYHIETSWLNTLVFPPPPLEIRFSSFENLRSLKFDIAVDNSQPSNATADFFLSLPAKIEVVVGVIGDYDSSLSQQDVVSFFSGHKMLKELSVTRFIKRRCARVEVFPAIAEHTPNLKSLRIIDSQISMRGFESLAKMLYFEVRYSNAPPGVRMGALSAEDIATFSNNNPSMSVVIDSSSVMLMYLGNEV